MRPLATILVRLGAAAAPLAVLLLLVVPPALQAQEVTLLSWNSCSSNVDVQEFAGPRIYKLVLSCIGATGPYTGHDTRIRLGPAFPIPDCWRFDASGCEGSELVSFSTAAFSEACPAFQGGTALAITNYGYDPAISPYAEIRLANVFDAFDAVSTTRYTLFVISFDMTYAVWGPGDPPNTCGGADIEMFFQSYGTEFRHADGHLSKDTYSSYLWVVWNPPGDCLPPMCVQAGTSTWGRVKATYR